MSDIAVPLQLRPYAGRIDPRLRRRPDAIEYAITRISDRFGVDRSDLLSRRRTARILVARKALCEALKAQGFKLTDIGRYLGLHHTSVVYLLGHRGTRKRQALETLTISIPDLSGEWAI